MLLVAREELFRISLAVAVLEWILFAFIGFTGASFGRMKGGLADDGTKVKRKEANVMEIIVTVLAIFDTQFYRLINHFRFVLVLG